jgi:hypothetical protein
MTKAADHINIQVPAKRAAEGLPSTMEVGDARLELGAEVPSGQRGLRRVEALWTRGSHQGIAAVEIHPTSRTTAEISVILTRPEGASRLYWTKRSLHRLAGLFAHAVRYDIETRSMEKADAFTIRRTSPELVRARAAAAVAM